MDELEILHGRLSDASMKVQHVRLSFIIPDWRLIVQLNNVVGILEKEEMTMNMTAFP